MYLNTANIKSIYIKEGREKKSKNIKSNKEKYGFRIIYSSTIYQLK